MTNNDVVMASTAADADALERQREAATTLLGRIATLESGVLRAAESTGPTFADAYRAVVELAASEVTPWLATAEARLLPRAAAVDRIRLLVEGLVGEMRMIEQAVSRLAGESTDRVRIASDVGALRALLEVFFGKTTELLLPALAADPGLSLADLVEDLPASAPRPGGCTCGEHDRDVPELDVREIPHAIRHATVFGAFEAVVPGGSMVLIAPHDPLPLLRQLTERTDGRLDVGYEQRGPQAWRLRLTRL